MKKRIFLFIVIYLLKIAPVNAQKFYAEVIGGYGFSIASQNLISKIDAGIVQTSNILVKGSFGRGMIAGGVIGYKFTENISSELEVSYLLGSKYKGYYSKELDFDEKTIMSANMLRLTPGIRISVGEGKIKPYARIGLVLRLLGKITIDDSFYDISSSTTTETQWKYSNGFSLGLAASLGISKNVNDKLSLFAELGMVNQSWGPTKGRVTKYSIDGEDMLSNLNSYQKQTDYSNSYTSANNNPSASSHPRQQLRQYYPFISI